MGALITPGTQVVVRDEEWLVKGVRDTTDGLRVEVTGLSEFVRDLDAVFFDGIDSIEPLDPTQTRLVVDDSREFTRSRLWLEALLRRTPMPLDDTRIAVGHRAMLDELSYQRRPAEKALSNLRPRILIADAVGLGKTLEIGILLAELIRRGRGERILVVTPRAVLEQFQRELWTRFAIPLTRLDSQGIQRVRQKLPASRNPFSYYRRVIISVDTIKNPKRYLHFLRGQPWDVVVIDECHNLINPGTQNNKLAQLLASKSEALILASATPHNGDPASFAELINLLDPTAIADPKSYTKSDIDHLRVRRHRESKDVRLEVAHNWKKREPTLIREVTPTPAEVELLDELETVWLYPEGGAKNSPVTGSGASLQPWTLFKAVLSSTDALRESIRARRGTLVSVNAKATADPADEIGVPAQPMPNGSASPADLLRIPGRPARRRVTVTAADRAQELTALDRLDKLAHQAQASGSSKLASLVDYLREIGVGPGSPTRAVVFTERIATLQWLARELPGQMGLPPGAVAILHSTLPDDRMQKTIEGFALSSSPVRILVASDMASEGINLHRQCHHLVHFDLPWSLIRLQQRNGRIDRYMQLQTPRIAALVTTPPGGDTLGDVRILTTLLKKEYAAYQAIGDAGALLGVYDEEVEEEKVLEMLRNRADPEILIPDPTPQKLNPFQQAIALGDTHASDPPPVIVEQRRLFESDAAYLLTALEAVSDRPPAEEYELREDRDNGLLTFVPPDDLKRRLEDLPAEYLAERQVTTRLKVTTSRRFGERSLAEARESQQLEWPEVSFLAPQHPVLEWVTDRALAQLRRNEAPVLGGHVAGPVFLTQGVWSNDRGQAVLVSWAAVRGLPGNAEIGDVLEVLEQAGIRAGTPNAGIPAHWPDDLRPLVPAALDAARRELDRLKDERAARIATEVAEHQKRLADWAAGAEVVASKLARSTSQSLERERIGRARDEGEKLLRSLEPGGEPFVRIVGVVVPLAATKGKG